MKIVIIPIEPLETRYTGEWFDLLPIQLRKHAADNGIEVQVQQIFVEPPSSEPTAGAFLDFASTNIYKSKQFLEMCKIFSTFKAGDKILVTDAWNPTVIQLRYMKDLMGSPVEIHGMWHAGSYDKHDFLGRAFDKKWSYDFERALFSAYDMNYFATKFHREMFFSVIEPWPTEERVRALEQKTAIVGWPMEYLRDRLTSDLEKKDLIVFPHRVSEEKQPDVFRDIARRMPQYQFMVCQDHKLTKAEYHNMLKRAKLVFSASLQETLGIGMYEGLLAGAIPVIPERLSYTEMFRECAGAQMYPSYYASERNLEMDDLVKMIDHTMQNFNTFDTQSGKGQRNIDSFFDGTRLYEHLTQHTKE